MFASVSRRQSTTILTSRIETNLFTELDIFVEYIGSIYTYIYIYWIYLWCPLERLPLRVVSHHSLPRVAFRAEWVHFGADSPPFSSHCSSCVLTKGSRPKLITSWIQLKKKWTWARHVMRWSVRVIEWHYYYYHYYYYYHFFIIIIITITLSCCCCCYSCSWCCCGLSEEVSQCVLNLNAIIFWVFPATNTCQLLLLSGNVILSSPNMVLPVPWLYFVDKAMPRQGFTNTWSVGLR